MLDFREELSEIKNKKLHCNKEVEAIAEKFLRDLLSKFELKPLLDLLNTRAITFKLTENKIKVLEKSGSHKIEYDAQFDDEEVATIVFMIIEQAFQGTGYHMEEGNGNEFVVYIKP